MDELNLVPSVYFNTSFRKERKPLLNIPDLSSLLERTIKTSICSLSSSSRPPGENGNECLLQVFFIEASCYIHLKVLKYKPKMASSLLAGRDLSHISTKVKRANESDHSERRHDRQYGRRHDTCECAALFLSLLLARRVYSHEERPIIIADESKKGRAFVAEEEARQREARKAAYRPVHRGRRGHAPLPECARGTAGRTPGRAPVPQLQHRLHLHLHLHRGLRMGLRAPLAPRRRDCR